MKADLLLSGCDVVTIDGKNRVIARRRRRVKGNKIVLDRQGLCGQAQRSATSTIDGSGQIAMPGLIDAHVTPRRRCCAARSPRSTGAGR
jgi:5-methylthioadenosine/S-adenosylhomocysteine deaminase